MNIALTRANNYRISNEYTSAFSTFNKIMNQASKLNQRQMSELQYGLALTHFETKQYSKAKPLFELLSKREDDQNEEKAAWSCYYLGRISFLEGQIETAIKYYTEALDYDSNLLEMRIRKEQAMIADSPTLPTAN